MPCNIIRIGKASPVALHTGITLHLLFRVYDETEYNWCKKLLLYTLYKFTNYSVIHECMITQATINKHKPSELVADW